MLNKQFFRGVEIKVGKFFIERFTSNSNDGLYVIEVLDVNNRSFKCRYVVFDGEDAISTLRRGANFDFEYYFSQDYTQVILEEIDGSSLNLIGPLVL